MKGKSLQTWGNKGNLCKRSLWLQLGVLSACPDSYDRKAWGTVTACVTKAAREEGGDGASVGMGKHACQGDCQEDQVRENIP